MDDKTQQFNPDTGKWEPAVPLPMYSVWQCIWQEITIFWNRLWRKPNG